LGLSSTISIFFAIRNTAFYLVMESAGGSDNFILFLQKELEAGGKLVAEGLEADVFEGGEVEFA